MNDTEIEEFVGDILGEVQDNLEDVTDSIDNVAKAISNLQQAITGHLCAVLIGLVLGAIIGGLLL